MTNRRIICGRCKSDDLLELAGACGLSANDRGVKRVPDEASLWVCLACLVTDSREDSATWVPIPPPVRPDQP